MVTRLFLERNTPSRRKNRIHKIKISEDSHSGHSCLEGRGNMPVDYAAEAGKLMFDIIEKMEKKLIVKEWLKGETTQWYCTRKTTPMYILLMYHYTT